MMRAVLVFCEGNHDVVFTTRSLGTVAGAKWMGQPISELPSPFGPRRDPSNPRQVIVKSFVVERIRGRSIDGLRIMDAAHPAPPSFQAFLAAAPDDVLFVLLRSGGDDAARAVIGLLSDLLTQLPLGVEVSEVAAAFLFDADETGIGARVAAFAAEYSAILDGNPGPGHHQWVNGQLDGTRVPVGLFIFHNDKSGKGTLEEVVAPMVGAEWPERWDRAGAYLSSNQSADDPVAKKRAEALKAKICITGQFLFPGDPMTQVLKREGLPKKHFEGPASRDLVNFLTGVPW